MSQAFDGSADDRRDGLLTPEDGLIDMQNLSVELKMETTAALLRMAILDVRKEMGSPGAWTGSGPRRPGLAGGQSNAPLEQQLLLVGPKHHFPIRSPESK